ncbi:hypothetical protein BDN70DRAFT_923047 [Pholiota conissans]|uniref:Heterokaryon incompatibility domain-containing protein n=1 Tax=Pholiota conissans TaxID=109636 RepID=A0A9P5YW25_9AGAR|nr:hypothetical protein BDN70DRAFT_923047 [Pholiota conissans]
MIPSSPALRGDHAIYASEQAQAFLLALRDMILRVDLPASIPKDNCQTPFGREGDNLLTSLREFISRVVHNGSSPSKWDTLRDESDTTAVSSERLSSALVIKMSNGNVDIEMDSEETSASSFDIPQAVKGIDDSAMDVESTLESSDDLIQPQQPQSRRITLENVALTILHQYVFNTMPIRLLQVEIHESQCKIALLDRSGIYRHLAAKVQAIFDRAKCIASARIVAKEGNLEPKVATVWVVRRFIRKVAKYAILSHTWFRGPSGDVTYDDWIKGAFDKQQPGYQKLVNFCRVSATHHGITLGWMDTVCINKESSAKLDESIRSMYKWYQKGELCITYLSETITLSEMHNDAWFTRGWTLQELIAPSRTRFYGAHWDPLTQSPNDKNEPIVIEQIERATTITGNELARSTGAYTLLPIPISRRMQWAAKRKVTREEDIAYSLMGIFNISISIAYGEGARQAFSRLVREILNSTKTNVLDIFNWGGTPLEGTLSSLLPTSPEAYLVRSTDTMLDLKPQLEPLTLTHLGIRIPILLMSASPITTEYFDWVRKQVGEYYATVKFSLPKSSPYGSIPLSYNLVDDTSQGFPVNGLMTLKKIAFGVLNFEGDNSRVVLPSTCLAVPLLYAGDLADVPAFGKFTRIHTVAPIVFRLRIWKDKGSTEDMDKSDDENDWPFYIYKNELAKKKMRLVNAYL